MTPRRRTTCRDVEVDGEVIRVRGDRPMTDRDREALGDAIRAVRAAEDEHPLCREREPDDGTRIVRLPCLRALDHEPPHRTGTGREW